MKFGLLAVLALLARSSGLISTHTGRLGFRKALRMSTTEDIPLSVKLEDSDSLSSPLRSLKEAYKCAKRTRNREALEVALAKADNFVGGGYVREAKAGHIVVSIYKLVDKGSGSYIKHALSTLNDMITRGITPDTLIFNNIIDMCAKSKCSSGYDLALEQLELMTSMNVKPDLLTYTSLITACAKVGRWRESMALMEDIEKVHGIKPDHIMYTSVIKACAFEGRWKESMELFATMRSRNVHLDSVVCNAVITACGNAGKWEVALKIADFMKQEGFALDHYTYAALVSACDKGGAGECVEALLEDMVTRVKEMQTNMESREAINKFAAPFNAVIKHYTGAGAASTAALGVFKTMAQVGVERNQIAFTTLITSLASANEHKKVLQIYLASKFGSEERHLAANTALAGSVIRAALALHDWETVKSVLRLFCSEHKEDILVGDYADALGLFHTVLAKGSKTGSHQDCLETVQLMEALGVPVSDDTYSFLVLSCKMSGLWEEAMDVLRTFKSMGRSSTKVFSACISVLVESKRWKEALSILDQMEAEGVTPNEVTYNSAIEALDASNEFVRAELVFQSALRSEGVYESWLIRPEQGSSERTLMLDLHRLPVAVARAAIMHTLGEMAQGALEMADPLVVVTGRGNHKASRYSQDDRRGRMRSSMTSFFKRLELKAEPDPDNAGRITLTREELESWMKRQEEDDAIKRQRLGGTAHGNLFLSVAKAKKSKPGDVRAVCPFSSATAPPPPSVIAEGEPEVKAVAKLQQTRGKCPAHAQPSLELDPAVQAKTKTKSKGCLTHAAAAPAAAPVLVGEGIVVKSKNAGGCPAHLSAEPEPTHTQSGIER